MKKKVHIMIPKLVPDESRLGTLCRPNTGYSRHTEFFTTNINPHVPDVCKTCTKYAQDINIDDWNGVWTSKIRDFWPL